MEKKKILFVISGVQFHKSEGALNRLNTFIDSYKKNGYEVDVLLFYSLLSFKYLFSKKKYLNKNAKWKLYPNLPISKNKLTYKLSTFINSLIFYFISRFKNYKIIQLEIQGYLSRFKPKRGFLITDFHGDSVSEQIFRNNNTQSWVSTKFITEQKIAVKYSDFIIVVSENLKNVIEINTGYSINKYEIISCLPDLHRFSNSNEFQIPEFKDRIVIGYIGGLQKWQNIDEILELVIALYKIDQNILFALFTNDDISKIQLTLARLGTDNYFIKPLKNNEVPKYLKMLDAGFILRNNLRLNIVSSPTKTTEYLASGVPVICTKYSGDYARYITHNKEGYVLNDVKFTNDDVFNLVDFLKLVKDNRFYYEQNCKESVKSFSFEKSFNALFSIIN